ncbi:LysR family transcriptional regulator [Paenibacillus xanthanilyticus]|uniref:LysR family transcriptional regulator n=1 Tax=Paenibacillus xanthanilyticus TaxID=1783531 RepID=A0ABV8K0E1_9BACL
MELYQLKTFREVASTGNLTEAAARLSLSQPAASAHLKALEQEVGFQLFYRTPKGMTLTPKGAKLAAESNRIIDAMEHFRQIANELRHNPAERIRIGLNTDGSLLRIQDVVEALSARLPQVEIHFLETKSENFVADLDNSVIEAGFFYGEVRDPSIYSIKLRAFPMAVVYPNGWTIPEEESAMAFFAGKPWIWTTQGCPFYQRSIDYFAREGVFPRRVMYVDDEFLIGELVQKELGCSLLAEPIARQFAEANKLKMWNGLDLAINLHFGMAKDTMSDPIRQALASIVAGVWTG